MLETTSVVSPTQIWFAPDNEMTGRGKISIFSVVSEMHPVKDEVKLKLAVPGCNPTIWPLFEIDAIEGALLVHIPPDEGRKCVCCPTQIWSEPERVIVGLGFIWISIVVSEIHPDDRSW